MSLRLISDIGRSLWGDRWQTDMARAIGVSDRTVRRWVDGSAEPAVGVYIDLLRLVIERASDLDDLIDRIKREGVP